MREWDFTFITGLRDSPESHPKPRDKSRKNSGECPRFCKICTARQHYTKHLVERHRKTSLNGLHFMTWSIICSKGAFGKVYRYPGYFGERTEFTEVSGLVFRSYRTYQSVGYRYIEVVPNLPSVGYWYRGRTELTDVGVKFVPNLTAVLGRGLRPYRTLPKTSIGYLPSKYPRYTCSLPNTPLTCSTTSTCSLSYQVLRSMFFV